MTIAWAKSHKPQQGRSQRTILPPKRKTVPPLQADCGSLKSTIKWQQQQIRATFYPKFENEKSDQEVHHSISIFFFQLFSLSQIN